MSKPIETNLPKVVIIGGGFGGLNTALALRNAPVAITIIDRTNHHLFQPLLYQVATAGLSPGNIASPIRHVVRKQRNTRVLLGEVTSINLAERTVHTAGMSLPYDYLIVATGARHSYFGNDHWEQFAPGLKTLDDALDLRRRILMAFETAETTEDEAERKKSLNFVVVGAGPTGVEMAGAIAELARFTLRQDFRHIDPKDAHVLLVEGGPRVLPAFAPDLSEKAQKQLEEIGVNVLTNAMVTNVDAHSVTLKDRTIATSTVVWAAGNAGSPVGKMLDAETDRAGRVKVTPTLTLPKHPEVFVIGDLVAMNMPNGKPVPAVSPAAIQMGQLTAKNIERALVRRPPLEFSYFDKGSMATIGRHAAVADMHVVRFGGVMAWLAWLFIHLIFLIGFENRAVVLLQWAYAYLTYSKGARVISGKSQAQAAG